MDGVSKQTKASSKAAEEAFYGFSDFFKDVDKELAERRARRAGGLLPASQSRRFCRCSCLNFCGPSKPAKRQAHLAGVLGPRGRIEQCCCTSRVSGSGLMLWAVQERLMMPIMFE